MTVPTLYFSALPTTAARFELDATATHQLKDVLRVRANEKVRVLNGQGIAADCTIAETGKKHLILKIEKYDVETAPPAPSIVLCQAWLKGDKNKTVVAKATELGATEIIFYTSERSISRAEADRQEKKLDKLQAVAIDGLRLSRRLWLPPVKAAASISELNDLLKTGSQRWLFWEEEQENHLSTYLQMKNITEPIVLLIGPEGGLSITEVRQAQQIGFASVSLGKTVIAADTAALAALSLVSFWQKRL